MAEFVSDNADLALERHTGVGTKLGEPISAERCSVISDVAIEGRAVFELIQRPDTMIGPYWIQGDHPSTDGSGVDHRLEVAGFEPMEVLVKQVFVW